MFNGNIKIITTSEIYNVVTVYFVSGGQILQPPTVTIGQAVTERNLSLLVCGELNGNRDSLLPVEEKERLGTFDAFVYIGNLRRKISSR
jgi:hypothetical protein